MLTQIPYHNFVGKVLQGFDLLDSDQFLFVGETEFSLFHKEYWPEGEYHLEDLKVESLDKMELSQLKTYRVINQDEYVELSKKFIQRETDRELKELARLKAKYPDSI